MIKLFGKKGETYKSLTAIVLFVGIMIVLALITIVIIINSPKNEVETFVSPPEPEIPDIEEEIIYTEISDEIFDILLKGEDIEELDNYYFENPGEEEKLLFVADKLSKCESSNILFYGDSDYAGTASFIELEDGTCFYEQTVAFTTECNYTREQMELTFEEYEEKDAEALFVPTFYFVNEFRNQFLGIAEILTEELEDFINETGTGNLTKSYEESIFEHPINFTFNNPKTGEEEIVYCTVY